MMNADEQRNRKEIKRVRKKLVKVMISKKLNNFLLFTFTLHLYLKVLKYAKIRGDEGVPSFAKR